MAGLWDGADVTSENVLDSCPSMRVISVDSVLFLPVSRCYQEIFKFPVAVKMLKHTWIVGQC